MDLAEINISLPEDSPAVQTSGLSPLDIKVSCNTNGEQTRENVKTNSAKGLATIEPLPEHDRHAVIVGGGPSLKTNWREILHWIGQGADIFALNGAVRFFNDRCILPTYQVIVDPRDSNVSLIGKAKDYLIASQCHPSIFDHLSADHVGLFHMAGSAGGLVNGTLIGGDVTVGLVAPCVAYTLGYRNLHLYGYDSSYAEGEHHAYDQSQSDQEAKTLEVFTFVNGEKRSFTTNYAMAKQAELFPKTAELLCDAGAVMTIHGTGLLPSIAQSMLKLPQAAE